MKKITITFNNHDIKQTYHLANSAIKTKHKNLKIKGLSDNN